MSCPPVPPPLPPSPMPNSGKPMHYEPKPVDEKTARSEIERQWMLIYGSKTDMNCISGKPEWLSYRHILPVAQEGPTCGLAALVAALGGGREMLMDILKTAQSLGVSKQGEMFSTEGLGLITASMNVKAAESRLESDILLKHLTSGGLVLVPYDAGPDHAPANCGGSRAHWALLCGILRCPQSKQIFVIAVQGKSRRHAVWPVDKLIESNGQLKEAAPDKKGYAEYTRAALTRATGYAQVYTGHLSSSFSDS